jgi:hypothetical protein
MRADHESFADFNFGAGLNVEECMGLGDIEAERLFAEDVLPCFGSFDRPWDVKVIRQWIVDNVNLRVGEKIFIGAEDLFDSESAGRFFRFGVVARGDCGYVRQFAQLHGGDDFF